MEAAINTVRSLAKPGETIQLCVEKSSNFLLHEKRRGSGKPIQQNVAITFPLANQPKYFTPGEMGSFGKMFSGHPESMEKRPGGLLPAPQPVSVVKGIFKHVHLS